MKNFILGRLKERTSLDGAVLIAAGLTFLFLNNIASLVAYAAIAYGAWTIFAKED